MHRRVDGVRVDFTNPSTSVIICISSGVPSTKRTQSVPATDRRKINISTARARWTRHRLYHNDSHILYIYSVEHRL